jgi:hypothetical protein
MKQGLGIREQGLGFLVAALLSTGSLMSVAQGISLGDAPGAAAKKGHLLQLSDVVTVDAGKAEFVELRFKVDEGYHINSHTPKDPLLIATALKFEEAPGVKVLAEEYPKGAAFQLGQGKDSMALDVYQGEFRVRVKVLAQRGGQTLLGTLHYQACDDASCFPPKNLPVKVAVEAK